MGLLIDTALRRLISATPAQLMEGVDDVNKQVHGCAVEMRVGDIYRPGTDPDKPGAAGAPRGRYALQEGETAVVGTIESFNLDDAHTAVVLPVSTVSQQGLLMTNPGHVDPGYKGKIHVTVINMGREAYMLKKGDRLLRALIYKLDSTVAAPYGAGTRPVTDELLTILSPDFLSVSARGAAAAKREIDSAVRTNALMQFVFPAIVASLAAFGSAWLANESVSKDLERRMKDVETKAEKANAEVRLLKLENAFPTEKRMDEIDYRVRALERTPTKSK